MKMMVIGASKGLGRAFVEGLCNADDHVFGVSRTRPQGLQIPENVILEWIEADLSSPLDAVAQIAKHAPANLDVIIYNLGIWEEAAFSDEYSFLKDDDASIVSMVNVNVTGTILLLKKLIPNLLRSQAPKLILTGSTSGLSRSGRPEVTFGASKFAMNGIAEALREGFRSERLAVTCLQLGYLNTEDPLSVDIGEAVLRGEGQLVPVHDVVSVVKTLLSLSSASYVRELVLPAILDERF